MSPQLSRRQFLAGGAAVIGTSYIPGVWSRTTSTPTRLPIPPLVEGAQGGPVDLQIRSGTWSFRPGMRTPTLGFSQDYLGPTIRTRQHSELDLRYRNTLTESVAVHGHGLHVPGEVDGGPQLAIEPGEHWRPVLSIVQPAATCWYHSHTHGKTGEQTYRGLAGLIIIDDEVADSLPLPRRYGVDDLPVVIQDRTFDERGRLVYSLRDADEDGWLGDTVVINGAVAPLTSVPAGKVRLRLLNGANARSYIVTFANSRTFYKIASDGGLLEAPVPLTAMEMSPGERCEIVIDMADGKPAGLLALFEDEFDDDEEGILSALSDSFARSERTLPPPSLNLVVDNALPANTAPLPERMAAIVRPGAQEIVRTRDFVLGMGNGDGDDSRGHGATAMTINGAAMDMDVINERGERGVWERWRIRSDRGAHPFHVHGCSFLIEQMEGATAPPDQQGWKDIVVADDDDWSEIVVRFDHPATERYPYMYHCHILEHEDHGMMGQLTVS